MAKVAVSSQGQDLQSQVDPRFGRAAFFLVVDDQNMSFTVLDNTRARDMNSGAGIQAAEAVSRAGAGVLLSGVVGPKAFQALETAGVVVVQDAQGSVAEAVRAYLDGDIPQAESPAAGHVFVGRGKSGSRGRGRGPGRGGGKGRVRGHGFRESDRG